MFYILTLTVSSLQAYIILGVNKWDFYKFYELIGPFPVSISLVLFTTEVASSAIQINK